VSTPASRTQKRQRQKEGAQARRAAELAAARKQQRTRRMVRVAIFAVIAALIVVAMSVFGGDDKKGDSTASSSSTTATTSATTATTAASDVKPPTCSEPDGSNTDLTKKPTVPVPAEKASELTCRDLVVGTGKEVKPGDTVTVQYVGVSQSTGKQFDASWDRGEPATFSLTGVIKGWTDGIPGMKVGGRRLLVIPGDQAYGPSGRGADIGPDDTLVFIVDVQDTKSA
jgi:peptidylprolyl isomerase